MKTVEVVAAVIFENGKVLATQRGYGEFEGLWEFPGGKIEAGETQEEALIREIGEELCVSILPQNKICTVRYGYPDFNLVMHCFVCKLAGGTMKLTEHKSARWLRADELDILEWLPADEEVVRALLEHVNR